MRQLLIPLLTLCYLPLLLLLIFIKKDIIIVIDISMASLLTQFVFSGPKSDHYLALPLSVSQSLSQFLLLLSNSID